MNERLPVPLDPKRFWDVIAHSIRPDERDHFDTLVEQLSRLRFQEILGFDLRLWQLLGLANRVDLWAAIYVVRRGCSDDSFCYFRCWLIAQGRRAFEAVMADPQNLIELADSTQEYSFENILGAACLAWDRRAEWTGVQILDYDQERKKACKTEPPYPHLQGENFDFDDAAELARRLPRLAAYCAARRTADYKDEGA